MATAAPRCRIRIPLAPFAGLLVCGVALFGLACGGEAVPRPNFVFVLVDTLRRDHLGVYGYERDTTPFIDSLAERGLVFERAVSQAPWTAASMASLWTSQTPSEVGGTVQPDEAGVKYLGRTPVLPLRESVPTLASRLSDAGYRTIAVVTNVYAGSAYGVLRGFEVAVQGEVPASQVVDRALAQVDDQRASGGGAPFFLYTHFLDLHEPLDPPPSHRDLFPTLDGKPHDESHAHWRYGDAADPEAEEVQNFRSHKLALYDGALHFVDDELRRLAGELDRRGLLDDTIFVIASDHGEEFWEHAAFERAAGVDPRGIAGIGHGHALFGEILDVPLIFAGPGVPAGRVSSQVRNLDVAPSVLGLAGLPGLGHGIDLVAARGRGDLAPLTAFSENIAYGPEARSLDDGRHKLVQYVDSRGGVLELLFDRETDPHGRRNVLEEQTRIAQGLRTQLAGMRAGLVEYVGSAPLLDEATLAALRRLGYLE